MAEAASALHPSFHSDESKWVGPGGTVVRGIDRQAAAPRRVRQRECLEGGDRPIPEGLEHRTQAFRLDRNGGFNRREAESLPADPGAHQAWLHGSENAQNKGKITPAVCETLH